MTKEEKREMVVFFSSACLFLLLLTLGLIWLTKNRAYCEKPATYSFSKKVLKCTRTAAGTYSARCDKYEWVNETIDDAKYKEIFFGECPDGYIKTK